MATQTVKGSVLPFLQNEVWDFDPTRGYRHILDFKGVSQLQMLALQQDYVRGGIACRLTFHQGDTATLDVEDSTMEYTLDVWQLLNNEERPDLFSHPSLLGLPDTVISAMRQAIDDEQDSTSAFAGGVLMTYQNTYVQRLYSIYLRGQTEYLRNQYVLRHTTNVSNRWTRNIADFNIDTIYTPAELLSEVQSYALWIFPMPLRLAFKIANFPFPVPQPNYLWGWLKRGSSETTAANNRVEINQEYILEQWSTDEYSTF